MVLTFGFLLLVVGFGPEGFHDGLGSPFDEGLSPELVAGVSSMNEVHLTALFGDRRDSAVHLEGGGVFEFAAIATKVSEKAGGQGGPGSGQGSENPGVLMFAGPLFSESVEALDGGLHGADLADESEDEFGVDFEDGFPSAKRDGVADDLETFFDDLGATAPLLVVELGNGCGPGFLKCMERGPFGEEGAGERCEEVAPDEIEGLGKGVLEGLGELVGEAGADADELAAFLGEQRDLVGERIGRFPGLKPCVALMHEECDRMGVAAIVLGAGGAEAFAVFLDDGRIDEVEAQEIELAEEVDQVLAGLLDAQGDAAAGRQFVFKIADPGQQVLRGGAGLGLIDGLASGIEDAEVEGCVGTVDADELVVFHGVIDFGYRNTQACSGDGFIGMSWETTTEESLLNKPHSAGLTPCYYSLQRISEHSHGRQRRGNSLYGKGCDV